MVKCIFFLLCTLQSVEPKVILHSFTMKKNSSLIGGEEISMNICFKTSKAVYTFKTVLPDKVTLFIENFCFGMPFPCLLSHINCRFTWRSPSQLRQSSWTVYWLYSVLLGWIKDFLMLESLSFVFRLFHDQAIEGIFYVDLRLGSKSLLSQKVGR